jgi:hypothetical protein
MPNKQLAMSIVFWWIPNILAAVGLAVCIIQGVRRRSFGLWLIAIYFSYNLTGSVVGAIRQHRQDADYVRTFVRQQIGPNAWTAPVLQNNINVAAPFTMALLVAAAILLSRQIANRPAPRPGIENVAMLSSAA